MFHLRRKEFEVRIESKSCFVFGIYSIIYTFPDLIKFILTKIMKRGVSV